MDDYDDSGGFDAAEFAENPEQRAACVLFLDTSGSMEGEKIAQLNAGLKVFCDEVRADSLAAKRVDLAVVTFGGTAQVVSQFCCINAFQPPLLIASGGTPMGAAIELGDKLIFDRKAQYRANGISYYRPMIFLITDGSPTDDCAKATRLIADGEEKKAFSFYAVGVEGADMVKLAQISVRTPLSLKGLAFAELFKWLSNSLGAVTRSDPNGQVLLANPAAPGGWATNA